MALEYTALRGEASNMCYLTRQVSSIKL